MPAKRHKAPRGADILRPLEEAKRRIAAIGKEAERLLAGAQRRGRSAAKKRARPAPSAAGTELLGDLEQQMARGVRGLLDRLNVPSRRELANLSERIAALEERLSSRRKPRKGSTEKATTRPMRKKT
jgi:hypothetical protein